MRTVDTDSSVTATPVLEARGITKRFGSVEALRGADFAVYAEEILALVGDNGAGKSTLVKVLSGALPPDEGELLLDGAPIRLQSPIAARRAGIETVYQDLALAPDLDAAANMFLGREPKRKGIAGALGMIDKRRMLRESTDAFRSLGIDLQDSGRSVGTLSGGQRQGVAVCRSVTWASRVVFLDEPTAALGVTQTKNTLDIIRRVKAEGLAVVLISHSMPDVMAVADRVLVLRLGRHVGSFSVDETSAEELVSAMTGASGNGGADGGQEVVTS